MAALRFRILLLILLSPAVFADMSAYRSNALAMPLQRLDSAATSGRGYELTVEADDDMEIRRLYRDGEEIERWEHAYGNGGILLESTYFDAGRVASRMTYDSRGRLVGERSYRAGELRTRFEYEYDVERLSTMRAFDPDEEPLYTETYAYSRSGFLREILRSYPDGSLQITSYGFAEKQLVEERILQDEEVFVSHYGPGGRLREWTHSVGAELVQRKRWTYREEVLRTLVETDLAADITTLTRYDEAGRVVEVRRSGSEFSETIYVRNEAGRLEARITVGGDGREEWRYFYGADGELQEEDYYRRGMLEKSRVYTGANMWYEEIYQKSELFLRIFYEEGEKVKEAFISGGKVVRERDYP